MNNKALFSFTQLLLLCCVFISVKSQTKNAMGEAFQLIQLTKGSEGHCLYNTQCFSPDDKWIVFDGRNDDAQISKTGTVSMVHTETFEVTPLYRTQNQSEFGPGVGGASFSTTANRVLFIHGVRNSDKNRPYGFARRTGVAIDIERPFEPVFMDARNVVPPFTAGALRGGTHAHTWSGDGKWISFTYNDYILERLEKRGAAVRDLRTVAVMVPGPLLVPPDSAGENNPGEMFAAVVASVTGNPLPGSDEIDKAFDEGWIGTKGYQRSDKSWQKRAIAFQGNLKKIDGTYKTEIYVLDLPDDLTKMRPGFPLQGTATSGPNVPEGVIQRRLTRTANGVRGPRHWLRTTADGKWIGFLSNDNKGLIQVFAVSPNGGKIRQLTFNNHSVQGPFNFSPDGESVAYLACNSVFVTELKTGKSIQITPAYPEDEKPVGSVIWSNKGDMMAFNKNVRDESTGEIFLQIFLIRKDGDR